MNDMAKNDLTIQALDAAEQCIVDVLEVYRRNSIGLVLKEAMKSLKHDALPMVRAARTALVQRTNAETFEPELNGQLVAGFTSVCVTCQAVEVFYAKDGCEISHSVAVLWAKKSGWRNLKSGWMCKECVKEARHAL